MPDIVKSPKAESDLESIWLYSFEQWDEEQADRYFDELTRGINKLSENPLMGRPRDTIRKHYRSLQINYHVIYYTMQEDRITIVRVLHERMVPQNYL